ncbi:MAG: LysR family transcriptional regulator [Aquabacterium sp.]|nr:MAG: LysR family transcriptional regulator [Aquabacterium sp.]
MVIDLKRLRHLTALVQHGNFHRAAEALHLTQPALTRSIQALEAHVGAPLLTRHRTGVEPTELGRLLLRHAGALEGQVRDLDRELRLAKGLDLGELRVGVGPWGGSVLVGPVVGRLNALHPGLQLKLVLAPWQELPERARAREVDVVLGELREIEQLPDFECAPLSPHQVCVVARAGHPLTRQPSLRTADLFDWPLAGPNLPETALQALAALAAAAGVPPERLRPGLLGVTCDSSGILSQVLQESDALSFMPRFMAEDDLRSGRLATLAVPGLTQSVRFGAAWLRGRTLGGAGEKFVALLHAHDAALRAASSAPQSSP